MARRQAARHNDGTGRIRRALAVAARLALVVGAVAAGYQGWAWLTDPATLPVRSVMVQGGHGRVSQARLRQVIEPFVAAGLLRLDVAGLRGSVEALPWVQHATVRRNWPDVLVVVVEEHQPLARWAAGGLLNAAGERFLAEEGSIPPGLPLLAGPVDGEKLAVAHFDEAQRMLQPLGLRVARLALDERRAVELELDSGVVVRLGRRYGSGRLLRLVRTYGKTLAPRIDDIESVDLRYTNGFAVRWKQGRGPATA